jgi:hypothetical protein
MERLTPSDLAMLWPDDHGWPQDIGVIAILDGRSLLDGYGLRDERACPHPVRPRGADQRLRGPRESITEAGLRSIGGGVVIAHSPRQRHSRA